MVTSPIQNQTVKAMAGTIHAMCPDIVVLKDPTSQLNIRRPFRILD